MEERHDSFGFMVAQVGWGMVGRGGYGVDLVGDVYSGWGGNGDMGWGHRQGEIENKYMYTYTE